MGEDRIPPATIIIPARNASATIERAVASACGQAEYPILLVDDFSTDDTVERAREAAHGRLKVVRPPAHQTLGVTRQTGLNSIETRYGIWLDADDALLPGRADRMVDVLEREGADLAADEAELVQGTTGSHLGVLRIPEFLKGRHPQARLFERNYLPGVGVLGFRTAFAKKIGFDPYFHGAEDIDFLLRAIAAGAQISLIDAAGYRLYAYPDSLSRQAGNQRRMYRAALQKHTYESVSTLFRSAGHDVRATLWGMTSMAVFRQEYERAMAFIADLERIPHNPHRVYEPGGPCPRPEGWRIHFQRGTLLLLMGRHLDAIWHLERAEHMYASPEGTNNLGVAQRAIGDSERAAQLFALSFAQRRDFLDPMINLQHSDACRITTHPLRFVPNRNDYPNRGPGQCPESLVRDQRESA